MGVEANALKRGWKAWLHAWLLEKLVEHYNQLTRTRKQALMNLVSDRVLEIGAGCGANLDFLDPRQVLWVATDINAHALRRARRRALRAGLRAQFCYALSECLPFPEAAFDAVICTLVLCSVRDPLRALREAWRVLKPNGRLVFVEHVAAASGTRLRAWQERLAPLWAGFTDGCRLNQETWHWFERVDFQELRIEHFSLPLPLVGPHIAGYGIK